MFTKMADLNEEDKTIDLTIKCTTEEAALAVLKILKPLNAMGLAGSSRGIQLMILDQDKNIDLNNDYNSERTGFDGDGSDKINLFINNKEVKFDDAINNIKELA